MRRRPRLSAFTLIEVLVAVTLLAVGLAGALAAFSVAQQWGAAASRLDDAVRLAEREMVLATAAGPEAMASREQVQGQFRWTLAYEGRPHGLALATITVHWTDRSKPQTYALSQVFKPGGFPAPSPNEGGS